MSHYSSLQTVEKPLFEKRDLPYFRWLWLKAGDQWEDLYASEFLWIDCLIATQLSHPHMHLRVPSWRCHSSFSEMKSFYPPPHFCIWAGLLALTKKNVAEVMLYDSWVTERKSPCDFCLHSSETLPETCSEVPLMWRRVRSYVVETRSTPSHR